MHREDIKAGLRKRGSSISQIARELGLSDSTVTLVVRDRRSRRVEKRISEVLDLPLDQIWPDRYAKTTKA